MQEALDRPGTESGAFPRAPEMAVTISAAMVGAAAAVNGVRKAVSLARKAGKNKEFKCNIQLGKKAHC